MTGSLKPYPSYKDSGVPWLGEAPAHWAVQRTKRVCRFAYGDSLPQEARQPGEIAVYGSNGQVGEHHVANTLAPCLVVGRKGSFGKVNYSSAPVFAIDTTFYVDQRSTQANLRWLYYLLSWIRLDSVSKDSAVPGLAREEVYQKPLPVPPPAEQDAIVRYLDHVDRRVRRYIRAKQKLIALLNEQKQAIIQQAVTRGLDPNVRLKPSGVEWLGDVPEHWEMRRNSALFAQRIETGYPDLPVLTVSLHSGVAVGEDDVNDPKRLIEDRSLYKRAVCGDIAYNMMRMWQGAVGVVPLDGLVSPAYVVAQPRQGTDARYFAFLFRTDFYKNEINRNSRGIVTDRNRLYWDDFKQMHSPVPPFSEQQVIVTAVERDCSGIDRVVANTQRQIALLREYRTRLIADVVTGKLDVRAALAALPAAADLPEEDEAGEALGEVVEESSEPDVALDALAGSGYDGIISADT